MKNVAILLFIVSGLQSQGQIRNIRLDDINAPVQGQVANPSVVINRKDSKIITVSCFLNMLYVSRDTGQIWTKASIDSPLGSGGDMQVIPDRKGDVSIVKLPGSKKSSDGYDRIVYQRSNGNDLTWDESSSIGLDTTKDQYAPHATVHPHSGALYVTWTQFNQYGSNDRAHTSDILFSQSKDGDKWSKPRKISQQPGNCLDDNETTTASTPIVSMDGKIGVVWTGNGKIYLDRSYNKGETWLANDLVISEQKGGSIISIPGLSPMRESPAVAINNGYDHFQGSLYVVWADQRNGKMNTDIWLVRTSNFGDYWTQPVSIGNAALQRHQFSPAMAVDQSTGCIYIAYFERNDEDQRANLILSFSEDGGTSFNDVVIKENLTLPPQKNPYEDFISIDAYRDTITPVWTQFESGRPGVWMSVLKRKDLKSKK